MSTFDDRTAGRVRGGPAHDTRSEARVAPESDAMTFGDTLAELLGLVGVPVTVTTAGQNGDPPVALVANGTLMLATELRDAAPDAEPETYYFTFEEEPDGGFFLHRTSFQGAAREGLDLRIDVGSLALRVGPED